MASFTEKELRIYEAEIRKKPLPKLYDELQSIIDDSTPERKNIVKARIAALEDRERRINAAKEKERKKAQEITRQKILIQKQPTPDKRGLIEFLVAIGVIFLLLMLGNGPRHHGLLFSKKFYETFDLVRFLSLLKFVPACGIFFWYFSEKCNNKGDYSKDYQIPSYWLYHFKLALSIASFFFFFSMEILFSGNYNGLFYTGTGLSAYIIGTSYFISSTLYIINTFFPLSKKFRPKYGITLLAFAATLELIISKIFG